MNGIVIELLLAVAGTSLALAGLASLISLFRDSETYRAGDVYVFRWIILTCIMVAIGGLLPLALATTFGEESSSVWITSSLTYIMCTLLLMSQLISQILAKQIRMLFVNITYTLLLVTAVLMVLNLVNVFLWQEPAPYVWGLLWGLVTIGFRLYLFLVIVTMSRVTPPRESET
jgi:hypothetical protein